MNNIEGKVVVITGASSDWLRQKVKGYKLPTTIISRGAVATELPNSITEDDIAKGVKQSYAENVTPANSFARAVAFAISQLGV